MCLHTHHCHYHQHNDFDIGYEKRIASMLRFEQRVLRIPWSPSSHWLRATSVHEAIATMMVIWRWNLYVPLGDLPIELMFELFVSMVANWPH